MGLAVGVALGAFTTAQTPTPQTPLTETEAVQSVHHSPTHSWALFHACDRNGDDRLDLFEAVETFSEIESVQNRKVFRAIDTNADGLIHWPEFDHRYRESIRLAGRFLVHPAREVPELTDPAAPPESEQDDERNTIMKLLDRDGDGALSRPEFERFVGLVELPAELAANFDPLDADKSGTLSATEFDKVLELPIPKLSRLLSAEDQPGRDTLPPNLRSADANRDGVIDLDEMQAALLRMDPGLGAWAQAIIAGADRSGNGSLGSTEIHAVLPPDSRGGRRK